MTITTTPTNISPSHANVGRTLAVVLGLLTIFGPISMDLYLPVLPSVDLRIGCRHIGGAAHVTACLLGLAGGQSSPGRCRTATAGADPCSIGVGAYVVSSALCAVSPAIETSSWRDSCKASPAVSASSSPRPLDETCTPAPS